MKIKFNRNMFYCLLLFYCLMMIKNYKTSRLVLFSFSSSVRSSSGKRLYHQLESDEPVIFIIGPKTADATPTVAILPIVNASPEARPAFCIPTSRAIARQSRSWNLNKRPDQYPKKYPATL